MQNPGGTANLPMGQLYLDILYFNIVANSPSLFKISLIFYRRLKKTLRLLRCTDREIEKASTDEELY